MSMMLVSTDAIHSCHIDSPYYHPPDLINSSKFLAFTSSMFFPCPEVFPSQLLPHQIGQGLCAQWNEKFL